MPESLTDDELIAVADDPQLVAKLNAEEKVRLGRLRAPAPQGPTGKESARFVDNAVRAMVPSTTPSDYINGPLYAIQHPWDSVGLIVDAVRNAHIGTFNKAKEKASAAANGDALAIPEAIGYGAATALPVAGPAAAGAGEQIASGDIAGGLGTSAGLLAPSVLAAAKAKTGPLVSAEKADRMSTSRMADAIAPKVGQNKIRFGNQAAEIAPALAREPSLGAVTREGLQAKVESKLGEAEAALDAAANARNAHIVYATKPIIEALREKVGRRTAQTARDAYQSAKTGSEQPIGKDVVPAPNRARVAQIEQAIHEIEQLGSHASYEALRRIRESYDGPAKAKYSPSMTADYLAKSGERSGAADVTGVLRDKLGTMDPATAKANADYALYKSAHDVLSATEEVQRSRPTTGRKMLTSAITGSLGTSIDPGVGTAIGLAVGPIVDEALNAGLTTKITTARLLAQYADAVRRHQPKRTSAIARQLKNVGRGSLAAGRTQSAVQRVPQVAEGEEPERQDARQR